MQSYGGFNLYKQMRYISSMIDVKQVSKGEKAESLQKNYVIFICTKNICGIKKYRYREISKKFKTNYYVYNCEYYEQVKEERLKVLLAYVYGIKTEHEILEFLERKIEEIKAHETRGKVYMDRYYREKAIKEEGKVEGLIEVQSDLIQAKFKVEAKSWLQQLTLSQLKKITKLILNANSFEEIQLSVK